MARAFVSPLALSCLILCSTGCNKDPKSTCEFYSSKGGVPPEGVIKVCARLCKRGDKDECSRVGRWRSKAYDRAFSAAGLKLVTSFKPCDGPHRAGCEAACKGGDIAYCLVLGLQLDHGGKTEADRVRSHDYYELACNRYDDRFICAQSIHPVVPGTPSRDSFLFDTSGCSNKRRTSNLEEHVKRCADDCFAAEACERLLHHDCLGDLEACERACTAGEAAYCRQLFIFYRDGEGVVKNSRTAAAYRMKACELKDQWSCSIREGDKRVFARKLKARPLKEVAGRPGPALTAEKP